ncbi:MAG: cupin domain-containing protein [Parvibaculum sedimenti]|uniref:cupin domain-containing protein n=1 Tax=Parvibaculum sedimenti TaxID=2608632 RepID=UPI003BB7E57C
MMSFFTRTIPPLIIGGIALCALAAQAADTTGIVAYKGKVLLDTNTDVLGKPVKYPEGKPRIISEMITLPVGATSEPNIHQTPMYLQVLEGELTVDYGTHGKKVYRAGDAFIEAQGVPHHGQNTGSGPLKFLAVYMGAEGIANEAKP